MPIRYWELLVEAEAPGVDFATTFVLPVYCQPYGARHKSAGISPDATPASSVVG